MALRRQAEVKRHLLALDCWERLGGDFFHQQENWLLRGIPHVAEAHAVDNGDNGDRLRAVEEKQTFVKGRL